MTTVTAPTVYLVDPVSQRCRDWLETNVRGETTWRGKSLAVGHRYVEDLVSGILEAGLEHDRDFAVTAG